MDTNFELPANSSPRTIDYTPARGDHTTIATHWTGVPATISRGQNSAEIPTANALGAPDLTVDDLHIRIVGGNHFAGGDAGDETGRQQGDNHLSCAGLDISGRQIDTVTRKRHASDALGQLDHELHQVDAGSRNSATSGGIDRETPENHDRDVDTDNSGNAGDDGQSSGDTRLDRAIVRNTAKAEGKTIEVAQTTNLPSSPEIPDQQHGEIHSRSVGEGDEEDLKSSDAHSSTVLPSPLLTEDPIILRIIERHRMRRRWLKARNALILQGKAFGRALSDGDKDKGSALYAAVAAGTCEDVIAIISITPFVLAAAGFDKELARIEREMAKDAKRLPIAAWVDGIKGFGMGSLAALVGEAGDIGQWRTVSGLWKRMGVAVIDGQRQRMVADAEAAIVHGYSPSRRSVLWNVGGSIIGGMGRGVRPFVGEDIDARDDWTAYQKLFAKRLRYEAERDPVKHGRAPVKDAKTGGMRESFSAHAAARAKRYVEKRLLRDLWAAWRRAAKQDALPAMAVPPELIAAE